MCDRIGVPDDGSNLIKGPTRAAGEAGRSSAARARTAKTELVELTYIAARLEDRAAKSKVINAEGQEDRGTEIPSFYCQSP